MTSIIADTVALLMVSLFASLDRKRSFMRSNSNTLVV